MKSKSKALEDIIREFNRTIKEEMGYPSIASSHPIPVVGLGHPEEPQVPDSFKGKLDLHDAVDTLFYQFSISQVLDAIIDHLMTTAQGAGDEKGDMAISTSKTDPEVIQNMLDSIGDLKRVSEKLR
jgi:hypothetical protein